MPSHRARSWGFTLLELLVVLSIIAIASAGVVLNLRDPNKAILEQNAERLTAQLEGVRAWSRSTQVRVIWQVTPQGYRFEGLPRNHPWATQTWELSAAAQQGNATDPMLQMRASPSSLILGPEPLLPPQTLQLQWQDYRLLIRSDGLQPFHIELPNDGAAAPAPAQP